MPKATIEDKYTDPFWIPGLIPIIVDSREADILVPFTSLMMQLSTPFPSSLFASPSALLMKHLGFF